MHTITAFIIFFIILVLYIHITNQFKKSEDLEIYEMDYISKKQAQDVFELRQPVMFDLNELYPQLFSGKGIENITSAHYSNEVYIKDTNDIPHTGDGVPLAFSSAERLIATDTQSKYFSENNHSFILETIDHEYKDFDKLLKPPFTVCTKYDLLFGSKGSNTALKYHTADEKFLCVVSGKIQVKMTPWKNREILHYENDYDNYEFRSPINPWKTEDNEKVKFLEFIVQKGTVLYVPPFWFYSIQFENNESCIYQMEYHTFANILSNFSNWSKYFINQFITKKKVLKELTVPKEPEEILKEIAIEHESETVGI